MITKNYYMIDDSVELIDVLDNLDILQKDGIILLTEIPNKEIMEELKEFDISKEIKFPKTESFIFSFKLFKLVESKLDKIAILYTHKSKKSLIRLAKKYVPEEEFCTYLYYLNSNNTNYILEWNNVGPKGTVFVSRDEVFDDNIFRKFCKAIDIDSYSVETFE